MVGLDRQPADAAGQALDAGTRVVCMQARRYGRPPRVERDPAVTRVMRAVETLPSSPPAGVTAGVDWDSTDHVASVVDTAGQLVDRFGVADAGAGLKDLMASAAARPGGRGGKRRQTREVIADTAMGLFLARGFEQVTVAEIATAADVAEKTVYNHFPVKAELVFDADDELLVELLAAVRERAVGSPAVAGVSTFFDRRADRADRRSPPRPSRRFLELVEASPTLRAYRREMFSRWEAALAALLAEDTDAAPGAAEPFVVAVAVVGVLRAGLEARTHAAEPAQHNSRTALDLLARGLAGYAPASPHPAQISGQAGCRQPTSARPTRPRESTEKARDDRP